MEERSGAEYGQDLRRLILEEVWKPEGLKTLLDVGPGMMFTFELPGVEHHVIVHPDKVWVDAPRIQETLAGSDVKSQCYAMDPYEYVRGRAEAGVNAIVCINYLDTLPVEHATELVTQMERVAKNVVVCWSAGRLELPDAFRELMGWKVIFFPDWFGSALEGGTLAYKYIEPIKSESDLIAPSEELPWLV